MIIDFIAQELAAALGLGAFRLVWHWGWPRLQAWIRDFAVVEPAE